MARKRKPRAGDHTISPPTGEWTFKRADFKKVSRFAATAVEVLEQREKERAREQTKHARTTLAEQRLPDAERRKNERRLALALKLYINTGCNNKSAAAKDAVD